MRRGYSAGLLIATVAMLCGPGVPGRVFAQAIDVGADIEPVTEEAPQNRFGFNVAYGHGFKTDLKNDAGKFSTDAARAVAGGAIAVARDLLWDTRVSYEYDGYRFSKFARSNRFSWNDVHTATLASVLKWRAADQWSVLGGPIVRLQEEAGADSTEAVTAGGLVGAVYRVNPDLSLGLAVGVMSQIEADAAIIPIPMIDWKFAPDWSLHTGISQLGPHIGIGGQVNWQVAKDWAVALGGQMERRRFRLDNKSNLDPAVRDGVGEDKYATAFAKVTWAPCEYASIDAYGAGGFNGTLRVENAVGDRINKEDYHPRPMAGVRVTLNFDAPALARK